MIYQVPHYINGKPIQSQKTLKLYNPVTGAISGDVAVADEKIINQAVKAALTAYASWSVTPLNQRTKIMFQFKALLEEKIDELAKIVTQEHGKTLAEAENSVRRGIDVVDFACGIPDHLQGSYIQAVATEVDNYSLRQPLGICVRVSLLLIFQL